MATSQKKLKFLTVFLSVFFTLFIGEILLQIALPSEDKFQLWSSNLDFTFEPDPIVINGIHGKSQFTINSDGLRGDEYNFFQKNILAIGGSTTIEMFLDNKETWTHLLQENLKKHDIDAWVGNAGKNGLNSFHHIDQMKVLLEQFPNTNTIIILMGINDLQLQLVRGTYTAGDSLERYHKTFPVIPRQYFPWFRRSAYWRLSGKIKREISPEIPKEMMLDKYGRVLIKHRNFRAACLQKIDRLPDLDKALELYQKNINTMIDIAVSKNIQLIFATQPVLWNYRNSDRQEKMMWGGGKGDFQENGGEYYTSKALDEGMRLFNKTLQETAIGRGIKVVDLYYLLPKDESIFYDDCHFTELGAQRVAEEITKELIQ